MASKDASSIESTSDDESARIFNGGGEMGALMRALDWAATPIGSVETWSPSLRTAVDILLSSRFPMLIWWGSELVMLYNDAYRAILGATKHPAAMGQRGQECWPEIWEVIGPMLQGVLERGEATWSDDQLLLLDRNGYVEECYFTFSYSPIRDESGGVGGVFTAVTETTARVLGERRLRTLRDLAEYTSEARTVAEVCTAALATLESKPYDLPFALLYLLDDEGAHARLAGTAGLPPDALVTEPVALDEESDAHGPWPLGFMARSGEAMLVSHIDQKLAFYAEPAPRQALLLPIAKAGHAQLAGVLVAGLSPRRALDDDYRGFLDLAAGQIATALDNARAYDEERRRAEALAELDRAKTTFFSNVSHEFRTPLTLLLGPLDDALSGTNPEAFRDDLEIARRNALRLLRLVNTLLDFSRIEGARLEAVYEPVDLAAYTAELAGVFRAAIERAGLHLDVDCPPLPEPVYVDRAMWEKIVLNLLSNAFKHTFAGEIAVTVRAAANGIEMSVRDTGTGIPAEALPHLFERFYRVRGARARTHEGSGIGLALVQELVRLHDGTITVDSAEGAGTTIVVTLPWGTAHLEAGRIGAPSTQLSTSLGAAPYVEEALRWLPDAPEPDIVPDFAVDEAVSAPRELERARVLLADDNADMRDYVTRLLRSRYDVEAVGDGAAALRAARARPPDLVLSDVMMPELDGIALLRELRADPLTRSIPVILLSARAGEESSIEGLEAGADDYLVKPFSTRELLARVHAHVELGRLRHEAREAIAAERDRLQAEMAVRTQAEVALRQQVALLALAHDAIIVRDPRGGIISWNNGAEELYGWTASEAVGKTTHELLHSRVLSSGGAGAETDATLAARGAWAGDLEHTRRDGTRVVVESSQALLRAVDGTPEAILEVNRDIAPRLELAAALSRLQTLQAVSDAALTQLTLPDLLRQLLTHIMTTLVADNAAILLLDDTEGTLIVHAAQGPEEAQTGQVRVPMGQGVAGHIAASRQPLIVTDLQTVEPVNPLLREQMASLMGVPLLVEGRLIGVLHVDSATPRQFTDDDLLLLQLVADRVALALDNARLYEAEQQAHAEAELERQHLRDVFMQAPAVIAVVRGPQHVFEVANQLYLQMVGLERHNPGGPLGLTVREVLPEAEGQGFFELLDQVYATGEPFVGTEMPVQLNRRGDGTLEEVRLNFVYQPYRNAAGAVEGIMVHAVEVTEQVRARQRGEELARQIETERDRLRQILDVLPVGVVIVDALGCVEMLNQAGRQIVGHDTRGQLLPAPDEARSEEYRVRRPDGTPYPPHEVPLRRSLLAGEEVRGDQELHRHAVTGRETPLLVNSAPLRGPDGAIVGAVAVFQDITPIKDLERAREEFLSSATHDLKTPLAGIRGHAQLARRRLARMDMPSLAPIIEHLGQIDLSTARMVELIDELTDLTREQLGQTVILDRQPTDLVTLTRGVVAQQAGSTEHRVRIETELPQLVARVDAARIERVLGNMLSNAMKYSPEGGEITVRIAREEGSGSLVAVIAVADRGLGIPAEDISHIFERFRRARNVVGQIAGTGIGLASAQQIVAQHGGTIDVESREGQGSTFTVRLPLMAPLAGETATEEGERDA